MKIVTQKLKVTPLIFNENFKNNESKMVFPQKQGGVRPLWKIPQKKMGFFIEPFPYLNVCLNINVRNNCNQTILLFIVQRTISSFTMIAFCSGKTVK